MVVNGVVLRGHHVSSVPDNDVEVNPQTRMGLHGSGIVTCRLEGPRTARLMRQAKPVMIRASGIRQNAGLALACPPVFPLPHLNSIARHPSGRWIVSGLSCVLDCERERTTRSMVPRLGRQSTLPDRSGGRSGVADLPGWSFRKETRPPGRWFESQRRTGVRALLLQRAELAGLVWPAVGR